MIPLTDPSLPGLATALDLEAMLELFRQKLPVHDVLQLVEVTIWDVQYKPGVHCRILYQLKFRRPSNARSVRQLSSVVILPTGASQPFIRSELLARYASRHGNIVETPILSLSETGLIAYMFPLDPYLPRIFDALDPATMKQKLKGIWARDDIVVNRVKVRQLGYTPQARAALSYDVSISP